MADGEFSELTKRILSEQVAQLCSKPDCRVLTRGPHSQNDKATNVGVAAHIFGRLKGSARYVESMTDEQRAHIDNGIWLCATHSVEIDKDEARFSAAILHSWKAETKEFVRQRIGKQLAGSVATRVEHEFKLEHFHQPYQPKRHEYELRATLTNTSKRPYASWYIELEMPRGFVREPRKYAALVEKRTSPTHYLFRSTIKHPILPGDHHTFRFEYDVTDDDYNAHHLVWDTWKAIARAYVDGEEIAEAELSDLQNF